MKSRTREIQSPSKIDRKSSNQSEYIATILSHHCTYATRSNHYHTQDVSYTLRNPCIHHKQKSLSLVHTQGPWISSMSPYTTQPQWRDFIIHIPMDSSHTQSKHYHTPP
eukprot:563069_1